KGGPVYAGRSSPRWYDSDSFFELCRAAGGRSARDLVSELEGCSGAKAGKIAAPFINRGADSLTREEAERLLRDAQESSKEVHPRRLGYVNSPYPLNTFARAKIDGMFFVKPARGTLQAELPCTIEAWAEPVEATDKPYFLAHVNRTPVT